MAPWWPAALGSGRVPSTDQAAAIVAPATGRHSVSAGAGTGKTSTLALRALYLIEAGLVRPDQIVVVTFTKKAAAELGSRIADTVDRAIADGAPFDGDGRRVNCTTIHALAAAVLREFAFEFGLLAPPRAIGDGEAYRVFHETFSALLGGKLGVDAGAFPIAELNLDALERDLGKLALRLKNHGIAPSVFASRALAQAELLGRQPWGQLWAAGAGANGKRKELLPKVPLVSEERTHEAERERANIRVVSALFADFDRRLAERGWATYGDLIGNTTCLLRERPALVARLRARWRYLLLDESQDTSILQSAFIETLFGKPGEAGAAGMMPVGDTRQAIYGFNGADEMVMERLAGGADGTYPLVVNRRSPQEIVDAGHAVLTAAGMTDTNTPHLEAAAGSAGLGCVRVQNFGEDGETIKEHVEREAAAIAREIKRLLADGATKSNDVAILVRRRTHAAAYVRALNEHGIAAALDRRSGLFVADEIRDAIAWMSLLLDLHDRRAAVRILQSPLCGLSDASMIALADRKDWLERVLTGSSEAAADADSGARLDRVRALLVALLPTVSLPLPAAMRRILTELPIAASYARLGETIGAQAIANLRGFEEIACAFAEEQPGVHLREFAQDVQQRILYDDDPQEAELDLDGVRVLTIHQAKGLEWPFVFVACSTKNQYGNAELTDRVVIYDLQSGAFALKNDVDGRETFRWNMLSIEHDAATGERTNPDLRKVAAQREQTRVFYVALTRAKRRVYVTAPAPRDGNGEAPYLGAIRAWAESIEPGVDLTFDSTPLDDGETLRRSDARPLRLVWEGRAISTRPIQRTVRPRVSFTAIAAFETCPRSARFRYRLLLPDLRDEKPRFVGLDARDSGLPVNAARFGSLAHRALELWGRAKIDGHPMTLFAAFEEASPEFADAAAEDVERARASAQNGADALANYTLLAVETPFELAFGETRVEGVIDLVARDPNGRLLVIDYKTGRTEDAHYALQLALYRRVALLRYPNGAVDGAILRLAPEGAAFTIGASMPAGELDRAIAQVGLFESDVARVGPWCQSCSYRLTPCMAPVAQAG